MKIQIKRYGNVLNSRPAGREAALSMIAYQKPKPGEKIELDFEGVLSVGPSWLDEVLSALRAKYGKERVICLARKNPSVLASLEAIDS